MLSDTLVDGLNQYQIGPKIRALRLQKKLRLVQLGQHTGLSPALLSKIECGQLFPTLPTLLRIALVFSVGLEFFFAQDEDQPAIVVSRKDDRISLPNEPGQSDATYLFQCLNFAVPDHKADFYYAEFPGSPQASAPHRHVGSEFIYLVRGELLLTIEGKDTVLSEGDSVQFDGSASHSYRTNPEHPCSAIVAIYSEGG